MRLATAIITALFLFFIVDSKGEGVHSTGSRDSLKDLPTFEPLHPTPTPSTSPRLDVNQMKVKIILTQIGAFFSVSASFYAIWLYMQYPHLVSNQNFIFVWGVIAPGIVGCFNYFFCAINTSTALKDGQDEMSVGECKRCGWFDQWYGFTVAVNNLLFWGYVFGTIYTVLNSSSKPSEKSRLYLYYGTRVVVCLVFVIALVLATIALCADMYRPDTQAWCWISDDYYWFRFSFYWLYCIASFPLIILTAWQARKASFVLNLIQRTCLWRRLLLAVFWGLFCLIDLRWGRWLGAPFFEFIQALAIPVSLLTNVFGFLFSERMLNVSPCGLKPGEEPKKGFTSVMSLGGATGPVGETGPLLN